MLIASSQRPKRIKGMKPTLTKKGKDYLYTRYDLYEDGNDFYLSMSGSTMKKIWMFVHAYRLYGAYEMIEIIDNSEELPPHHLTDLILEFYKSKNLDFYKETFMHNLLKSNKR